MFDLTTSKFLLLGIIALLVVGPKELPGLLRTVGRYVGMIKRQAAEFRSQFDDAIKETEIADLKKQVEDFGREAETAVRDAETSFKSEVDGVQAEANRTLSEIDAAVQKEAEIEQAHPPVALAAPETPELLETPVPTATPSLPAPEKVAEKASLERAGV